jgi:hypothetical protein
MKAVKSKPRTRSTKRTKRTDRGVTFEEMLRLMRIYGSVKCLRKRQNPDDSEVYTKTRIESVKRKFYRWFPDLDERFTKDENGMYWPNCGHEGEIRYREEMRKKDSEIIVTKRVTCRRDRHGTSEGKTKKKNSNNPSDTTSAPESVESGSNLTLNENSDPIASYSSSVDIEPIDCSFLEHGILDDFDSTFYGLPPTVSSSCSSIADEPDSPTRSSSSSWESDIPMFIHDNLAYSIATCDEILSSDDGDSVSDYLFDMAHEDI